MTNLTIEVRTGSHRERETILTTTVPLSQVRLTPIQVSRDFPTLRVEVYPEVRVEDCDGDPCMIVRFDLLNYSSDFILFPSLLLYGTIRTMRWSDGVDVDHYGDPLYVPTLDPEWDTDVYEVALLYREDSDAAS